MSDHATTGKTKALAGARRADVNGWIYLHIEGEPYERGYQHGYLLAAELREALRCIRYLIYQDTGVSFDWFAENARAMYEEMLSGNADGILKDNFGSELLQELEGIVAGANANRRRAEPKVTLADLIGWNAYPELICQWWPAVFAGQIKPPIPLQKAESQQAAQPFTSPVAPPRWHHFAHSCSAFIASGKSTADGGIVVAQTTWQRFANGDAYNLLLDVQPASGHRLLMQSVPGYVHSSTDFWLTGAGLVIAETSLNVNGFDPKGLPEFVRVRRACQHADSIRAWRDLFRFGNNGGYVNTWLLGDARRGEIAAYELTLNHDEMQPIRKSGYYASCNIPLAVPIRNLDNAGPSGYDNIQKSGARRLRFEQLLEKHRGKIDAETAKAILADHYDVYLEAVAPSGRTICGHFDNDDGRHGGGHGPYYPWGSLDAKVTTGELARRMTLLACWGRACGMPLDVNQFLRDHAQYQWLDGYMKDRPTQPWTAFTAGGQPG
jgi:hypothetical protein